MAKSEAGSTVARNEAAERTLFYSLWGLLLLGVAIWRFWPNPDGDWRKPGPPPVTIGDELTPWFEGGSVTESLSSRYTLQLALKTQYREKLSGEDRDIQLSYQLMGDRGVLLEGSTPCHIDGEVGLALLFINNPRRVSARGIKLGLAH